MVFLESGPGRDIPPMYELVVDALQWATRDFGVTVKYFRNGDVECEVDRDLKVELG